MYKMTMFLGLLVAIMSVNAFGAGIIGTPTAGLEKGQWNVGFNYTYIDIELDKTTVKSTESTIIEVSGSPDYKDISASSGKMEIDNVKTQRYYGTIGYGLTNVWEVYVQLGIADLKAKTRDEGGSEWDGINFDNDFAWGWGTRYTFYEQNNIRWGASLQMNWLNTSWESKDTAGWDDDGELDTGAGETFSADTQVNSQLDWSTYDLLIAVGPTVDMGGWNLYGGPFYFMQKGDLDYKQTTTAPDGRVDPGAIPASAVRIDKGSGDLEADSIGGFVGAQYTLMEKYNMTAEVAFSGSGWAIGAGINVPF